MKRLVLLAAVMISTLSMNAQEFNAGLSGAVPIGDADDVSPFGFNVDLNYLTGITESFDVGLTAGYQYYFGKDDLLDTEFLPIAAAGRYDVNESFTLGADVGYAIGVSPDLNDGGFYYAPKVQYSVLERLDVVLAFRGISLENDGHFNTISLGVEFGL